MLNGAVLASSPIPQTEEEETDAYVPAEECKAYVAVRIKANDCCPGKASGKHYSDCSVGGIGEPGFDSLTGARIEMGLREWKPGDSVVLPIYGECEVKRITDDPESVTIPLTFERSRCVLNPDDFVYGDGSPLSEADKRALFGKRRSVIAAMMSARRARARKGQSVHSRSRRRPPCHLSNAEAGEGA